MSKFWSNIISDLDPYVPGEQPKNEIRLKLNTNENPFLPAKLVIDEIRLHGTELINRYPDPESFDLRKKISEYHNCNVDEVFVGNGSDEILAFIFYGLFKDKSKLLFPDITYSFYPVYSKLFDIKFQKISLNKDYEINLDDFNSNRSAIIFPNPNAPTGIPLSLSTIEHFLDKNSTSVVVIDEAYVDFGTETAIPLVKKYNNLLVTRSFSKSRSLAGLRVGYAIGSTDLIEGLVRIKNSFNSYPVDRIAQKACVKSFEAEDYFKERCNEIILIRNNFVKKIKSLGFNTLPSGGNFVFTKPSKENKAKDIYDKLRKNGILIRFFDQPRISSYLRITIGTNTQMEILLDELKKIIS
jgi:histidinol-phosphate aminotransferase